MTEAEWLACTDPTEMLEFIRGCGKGSERKFRLFAVACCRHVWPLVEDDRSRRAVMVAERYADGEASDTELFAAAHAANEAIYPADLESSRGDPNARYATHLAAYASHTINAYTNPPAHARPAYGGYAPEAFAKPEAFACMASCFVAQAVTDAVTASSGFGTLEAALAAEFQRHATYLRDFFGNPFRPVTVDPLWLSWDCGTVVKLAQGIYDERAFDRLPVLADALEDAGCTGPDILSHCRSAGPHVRGCWVVDLILGKQ
jgi:hypothetical protein